MHKTATILALLIAGHGLAGEPVITCSPQELRGVPGEPLQLEITIETDRALPAKLGIPHIDNLYLRTVETVPIQRTEDGCYVQKRIVIWQGLESGSIGLTNLAIRFQESDQYVPEIKITIDDVKPAEPPETTEENE